MADTSFDDHYARVRERSGLSVNRKPSRGFKIGMPKLELGKGTRYAIAAAGLFGFLFFPQPQQKERYSRIDVKNQVEQRLGSKVIGNFELINADVFPPQSMPYDLSVTIENKDYRTGATLKGELGIDYSLSAIRITNPNEVIPFDVETFERSTADTAASYVPDVFRSFANKIANIADSHALVRAQADAQAVARDFIIYRLSDSDVATFKEHDVLRVDRTDKGLTVVYVAGWSPSNWSSVYWLFLSMLAFGGGSVVRQWR